MKGRVMAGVYLTLVAVALVFFARDGVGTAMCEQSQRDEDGDHAEFLGWSTARAECVGRMDGSLVLRCHDTSKPELGFFPVRDLTGRNLPIADWSCRRRRP